jgi:hypothetical protein
VEQELLVEPKVIMEIQLFTVLLLLLVVVVVDLQLTMEADQEQDLVAPIVRLFLLNTA